MKPLARLYLNRQRLYEKTCKNLSNENTDTGVIPHKRNKNKACRVTSWGPWGKCSVTCGKGSKLRQRHYRNEATAAANKCNTSLTDRASCFGDHALCTNSGQSILNTTKCEMSEWGSWSKCSASCGLGSRTRSRKFIHKKYSKQCRSVQNGPVLQETSVCQNNSSCVDEDEKEVSAENIEGEKEEEKEDDEGKEVDNEKEEEREEEVVEGEEKEEEEGEKEEEGMQEGEKEEGEEEEEEEEEMMQEEETEENEVKEQAEEQAKDDLNYENDQPNVGGSNKWSQKCPEKDYNPWSQWSPCSASCGEGTTMRFRTRKTENIKLRECEQEQTNCTAAIKQCDFSKEEAKKICSEPMVTGNCTGNFKRMYFNKKSGKCEFFTYSGCNSNRNNFETIEDCNKVCENQRELRTNLSALMKNFKVSLSSILSYHIPAQEQHRRKTKRAQFADISESSKLNVRTRKVDCRVSEWSNWSPCFDCQSVSYKRREILITPEGGGKKCPEKMRRRKLCRKMPECSFQYKSATNPRKVSELNEVSIDCKLTSWSSWSQCTATCGKSWQQRIRNIKVQPRGHNAKICGTAVEFRNCTTIECP